MPERHAGLRDPLGARRSGAQRDAEVGDERVPSLEQDVLGLDVAVNHAVAVGVVERPGDLAGDAHRVVHRELLLAGDPVAERLPLDVRHHVVDQWPRSIGDRTGVEERQDVGMLQLGGGPDLGEEALGAELGGEIGMQQLDRHLAVVLEVVREIDRGHAARAELALDAVAVGEGGGEASLGVAHWCFPKS